MKITTIVFLLFQNYTSLAYNDLFYSFDSDNNPKEQLPKTKHFSPLSPESNSNNFLDPFFTLKQDSDSTPSPKFRIPNEGNAVVEISRNATDSLLPSVFNLLVWNVHKGEGGPEWENDFREIIKSPVDLVLLQEAMKDDFMSLIFKSIDSFSFFLGESFIYSNNSSTGVALGSKVRSLIPTVLHSPGTEPFIHTPKSSLFVHIPLSKTDSLLVINVHALNFNLFGGPFEEQMNEIFLRIKQVNGKVLLAGDFNTWNNFRLKFLKKNLAEMGFEHIPFHKEKVWLDHVFIRGCSYLSPSVLEDIKSSDHSPLTVKIDCTHI